MTAINDNASVSPLLTTAEAASYLRFRTASGIRTIVARGELIPLGAGPKGSHLFTREELDRFAVARAARYARPCLGTGDRKALPREEQATHTLSGRVPPRPGDVLDPREGGRPSHGQKQGDRSDPARADRPRGRAEARHPHQRDQASIEQARKVRVGEFAQSWIESKTLKLDSSTAKTYADALDKHILPALGDFYYDTLTTTDVQRWIDNTLLRGWTSEKRGSKRDKTKTVRRAYTRDTVAGWFRVLRTMTRDAMAALQLPRDPTLRIVLPEESVDDEESNALTPAELAAFLDAMKTDCKQHYPLVVLLAYTGLRFCHASALHWEDWDEQAGVLRISRKNVRGKLGSVTRKKRAPK
jgi:hypothetical protein